MTLVSNNQRRFYLTLFQPLIYITPKLIVLLFYAIIDFLIWYSETNTF